MRTFGFIILVLAYFSGCDESLPPRDVPPQLFTANIRAEYFYYSGRTPQSYHNQINYFLVIKNVFDETIQDTMDFKGSLMLTWITPTSTGEESTFSTTKSVQLTRSSIKYVKNFNNVTGIITFDPKDSMIIEYDWNFITDDSTNLLERFPSYRRGGDSGCSVSPRQTIRVSANIHLMKSRGNIIVQPHNFTYCFFTVDGNPPCSDFIFDPCD